MKWTFKHNSHQLLIWLAALVFVSVSWTSCGKNSSAYGSGNMVAYTGTFVKDDIRDSTHAFGAVTATFNTTTLVLSYTITWHSLSSNPVAMHFHDAGPVIVPITGFPVNISESVTGTATFTSSQASDLASGFIYAMIHTVNYSSGEIKAYLIKH